MLVFFDGGPLRSRQRGLLMERRTRRIARTTRRKMIRRKRIRRTTHLACSFSSFLFFLLRTAFGVGALLRDRRAAVACQCDEGGSGERFDSPRRPVDARDCTSLPASRALAASAGHLRTADRLGRQVGPQKSDIKAFGCQTTKLRVCQPILL